MDFRTDPRHFTKDRLLTLEHTIGFTMSLSATRNGNGYDISSQNYFRALGEKRNEELTPVKRQSVSEARGKIHWSAFEFLLERANLENKRLPKSLLFKGHVTRALDGTSFFTPRSDDLLSHFSPRHTKSEEGETHYPYGLCVAAINVFTGQPTKAVIDDYKTSERSLLGRLIGGFAAGDLSLLDRGLGGTQVYLKYDRLNQFFIHRAKTSGDRVAGYIAEFLPSDRKQKVVSLTAIDDETGEEVTIKLRLIRGPIDSEGKPIVFVTNLIDKKRYLRREIIDLYRKRWGVETLYDRVKNLLRLEKFHAQSYNGVMQEIFANLLVLSLTALAVTTVVEEDSVNTEVEMPGFKNAAESVRRHLFAVIDHAIEGKRPKQIMEEIVREVRAVKYRIRPNRRFPRVSKQPIKSWNLKKSAKIRAFAESNGSLA